jgi:hypothetical protein
LQEKARLLNTESWKFINGTFDYSSLDCKLCPAFEICHLETHHKELCYSNVLNWMFYEGGEQ